MECYVTYSIKGFYAFNENNELIGEKLFKEEEILQKLIEIDNKEIPTEESELIKELSSNYDTIIMLYVHFPAKENTHEKRPAVPFPFQSL